MTDTSNDGPKRGRIENLIDLIGDFRQLRQKQQVRGLNDFNVFTTLLDPADEVRLHSRFIALLLDPNGDHGQGGLFLQSFLRQCVGKGFELDTTKCEVKTEHATSNSERLDIYLTDGRKQLVIENKIYAQDGDKQLQRYVEVITSESTPQYDHEDLMVIYLSLGDGPSSNSLANYEIDKSGRELRPRGDSGKTTCSYRHITYDRDIHRWIREALTQVVNITNLSVALTQYLDVIDLLYGRYEEKTMNLAHFLKDGDEWNFEHLRDLKDLVDEFPEVRKKFVEDLLSKTHKTAKEDLLSRPHEWAMEGRDDKSVWAFGRPPQPFEKNPSIGLAMSRKDLDGFGYMLTFAKADCFEPYFLVHFFDFRKLEQIEQAKKAIGEEKLQRLRDNGLNTGSTNGLCWRWARERKDIFDVALKRDIGQEAEEIVGEFKRFFGQSVSIVDEFVDSLVKMKPNKAN